MKMPHRRLADSGPSAEILSLATHLVGADDLQPLAEHIGDNRLVCIGEA